MKILYLTKYMEKAASSRMRSFQYFPYLEKEGFEITVKPFFDDNYIKYLYAGEKNIFSILKAYIKRFFALFTIFKYDKLVIEKEVFPYFPAWAEWLIKTLGIKYIVDYDDAIFHNYDLNSNFFIRNFIAKKIDKVMKYSSLVVAGNSYLAERAKNAGAKNIEIIPTVIDLECYSIQKKEDSDKFVVGWIGTKSTFEKHFLPCANWINELEKSHPEVEFHVVGIQGDNRFGENVKWIPWKKETEVSEIQKMDVGIMPLQDSLWEKGKCAYKLIQYGACGIPGIASDVGMNNEVTIPNETGYLVDSDEDWSRRIIELKNNREERIRLGKNARKLVEEKYCIQVTAKKWGGIMTKQ